MLLSNILSTTEYQVLMCNNQTVMQGVLTQVITPVQCEYYTRLCLNLLLSKTAPSPDLLTADQGQEFEGECSTDVEYMLHEPEEWASLQDTLVEKDWLRITAEGLYCVLLDQYPDVVTNIILLFISVSS